MMISLKIWLKIETVQQMYQQIDVTIFTCVASQYLILCDITATTTPTTTTTTTTPRFLKMG